MEFLQFFYFISSFTVMFLCVFSLFRLLHKIEMIEGALKGFIAYAMQKIVEEEELLKRKVKSTESEDA